MSNFIIRKAEKRDYDRVLEMNEESVHFLSPMNHERLELLASKADIFVVIEKNAKVEGFILAFRENSDYDSVNYQWFNERYDKFLYIDRVVISIEHQSEGLGEALYKWIFDHAEVDKIAAEIDIEPPNPTSLAFHKNFGFKEVGQHSVAGGTKVVSLEISEL